MKQFLATRDQIEVYERKINLYAVDLARAMRSFEREEAECRQAGHMPRLSIEESISEWLKTHPKPHLNVGEKEPAFRAGDLVTHALDASRAGMVTSYSEGFNGFSYRVTWKADFEDQAHYQPELVGVTLDKREALGFGRTGS